MPAKAHCADNTGKQSGRVTAHLGHIISPVSLQVVKEFTQGALIVSEQGQILACGDWKELRAQWNVTDIVSHGKRLLLPGFIDTHVHLPQFAQIGRAGKTLLGWLNDYIFTEEAKFFDAGHARDMSDWFFRELVAAGTTCASIHLTTSPQAADIAFQTAERIGCRTLMGVLMMDMNSPEALCQKTQDSLRYAEELCKTWHDRDHGRLRYSFTPRFAATCSGELMDGISKLWKKYPGTHVQTHLSESPEEIAWIKELFPACQNYLDVYHQHGLTGERALFAHAIHLEPGEFTTLAQTRSAVSHCPSSNFFLKSGSFPLAKIREFGISCGLGSDVAAGPSLSLMQVMKDAAYIQPSLWLSPSELFYMATQGSADALRLGESLGSLDQGKEADFIVVDPALKSSIVSDILDRDTESILSSIAYTGDERIVAATYVRGRRIYLNAAVEPADPMPCSSKSQKC